MTLRPDVAINCGTKQFQCDRHVLSANSDFFKHLFASPLEQTAAEFTLTDINPATLESCICFFESSDEAVIQESHVLELLAAADYLQASKLKQDCSEFVLENAALADFAMLWSFAEAHNCLQLAAGICNAALLHGQEFFADNHHLDLTEQQLLELTGSDDLTVDNEDHVWEAVKRWYLHDRDRRMESFERMLDTVRFALCGDAILFDDALLATDTRVSDLLAPAIHRARELVCTDIERDFEQQPNGSNRLRGTIDGLVGVGWPRHDLLVEDMRTAETYVMGVTPRHQQTSWRTNPLIVCPGENGMMYMLAKKCTVHPTITADVETERQSCGSGRGVKDFLLLLQYDSRQNEWTDLEVDQSDVSEEPFEMCASGDAVHFFDIDCRIFCFSLKVRRIVSCIRLAYDHYTVAPVSLDGCIYLFRCSAVDVESKGDMQQTVMFNPVTSAVEMRSPSTAKDASSASACITPEGTFYVLGIDYDWNGAELELYDPKSDSWTILSAMHGLFYHIDALVYFERNYYAFGKQFHVDKPFTRKIVYNENAKTWADCVVAHLDPQPRYSPVSESYMLLRIPKHALIKVKGSDVRSAVFASPQKV